MNIEEINKKVDEELQKAYKKFPWWPNDFVDGSAIVAEEAGELTKACLGLKYGGLKYEHRSVADCEEKAIHVIVMAIRFLMRR